MRFGQSKQHQGIWALNNWVVSVFLVLFLTACGGGGGSSASDPSPTSTTPSNSQPNAQNTEITLDEDTEYSAQLFFDLQGREK